MTKCLCPRKRNERKRERKLRSTLPKKLLRKEATKTKKFDLREAQKCANEIAANDILAVQTQIKKLQNFLHLACEEVIRRKYGSTEQKNEKKVKRARKVKKSYHEEKVKIELQNLTKKLNKVREANTASYKNLIREFKHLISEEQDNLAVKKNDKKSVKKWSAAKISLYPQQAPAVVVVAASDDQKIAQEKSKSWLKFSFKAEKVENDKNSKYLTFNLEKIETTETSGSDDDFDIDAAESSGSGECCPPKFAKTKIRKSFLHELESQLFNSSSKKLRKPKRKRKKIPKNRFKKLKHKLDQLMIQRIDDFVNVDPQALDHDEFDFCDISEEADAKRVPCGASQAKFKHAMAIIKQKKYKLKKTKKYVQDIEGIKVKTSSAYHSALSKIFQRRKHFDIEDENEDMMDIDM